MAQIVERKGKNGQVTFCVRIRRMGAKDATATFKRRNDAKRWITETENAVIDGRYFLRAEERKHTVKEVFERYLLNYPKNRDLERHLKKWSEEIGHCAEWPNPRKPKAQSIAEMETALNEVPGQKSEFLQPIQMRFNELIAGVRSEVAIKIFGDDLDILTEEGKKLKDLSNRFLELPDLDTNRLQGFPFLPFILEDSDSFTHRQDF